MSTTAPTPSIPEETLGERMRRALRKEHIGVQEMADYLGVARNTVSTWLNDRIEPSEQTLMLWAMRTGVPLEWLKHGLVPFPRRVDLPDTHTGNTGPAQPTGGYAASTRRYHLAVA